MLFYVSLPQMITTITSISVLNFPNISILFWIKTDSLDFGAGTMLFQESKADGK